MTTTRRLAITRPQLREAIRAVFYPRVPLGDADTQERIDRATQRVVDAIPKSKEESDAD